MRAAYRSLTQKWHPDENPECREEAERISNTINAAYAVLSDHELRREYDEWIAAQRRAEAAQPAPAAPSTPPPPKSPSPLAVADNGWQSTVPAPWRRYFARMFDSFLIGVILWVAIGFAIGVANPSLAQSAFGNESALHNPFVSSMFTLALVIPFTAALVGFTGTTIGKWIFGVRVTHTDGSPIGYKAAIQREVSVWLSGLALGVPLISLATLITSYQVLKKKGATSWDEGKPWVVTHRPFGGIQLMLSIGGVVLWFIGMAVMVDSVKKYNLDNAAQSQQSVVGPGGTIAEKPTQDALAGTTAQPIDGAAQQAADAVAPAAEPPATAAQSSIANPSVSQTTTISGNWNAATNAWAAAHPEVMQNPKLHDAMQAMIQTIFAENHGQMDPIVLLDLAAERSGVLSSTAELAGPASPIVTADGHALTPSSPDQIAIPAAIPLKPAHEAQADETEMSRTRKAAEQGDANAQNTVGSMYYNGVGVPRDYIKAMGWFRKAAAHGNALAQFSLGRMYHDGLGLPQDYSLALGWFRTSAAKGYAAAQLYLGIMYDNGQGTPRNYPVAAEWYRKAAAQGDADAQYNLAAMYVVGQGVPRNYTVAVGWFRKAAAQGDAGAQNNLGTMYAKGQGVPQDLVVAYALYNLSASVNDSSDNPATGHHNSIMSGMTPAQIAAGKALIQQMQQVGVQKALDAH